MKIINSEIKIKKPLVWLEINKANLLKNVAQMKRITKESRIMAVLKANAYGLGVLGVASTLQKQVDAFSVVGMKEAITLRESGITKPIINLGIYSFEDGEKLAKNKINPTIFTYTMLRNFEGVSKKLGMKSGVWIKIDTGLGRLGLPYQDALKFIRSVSRSKNIKIEGVLSSFTEDKKFDKIQLKRFLAIKESCQKEKIKIPVWSIASSEATFLFPESNLDMVRLGISLLGFYPSFETRLKRTINLSPALSFKTKVACIKELGKGESIFYRGKFIAKEKTRIAVLLPGYSYGLDSRLVNGGKVIIGGKKYPLIGGITMTNCFADIGSNKTIKAGDEVVILGKQKGEEIKLEEICTLIKQGEYEFLSRIPEKVDRVYV